MRWLPAVLLIFTLVTSACSSDPTEVVAGSDDSTDAAVEDSSDATESVLDEKATTTTISAVANDSAPVAVGESGMIETLGISMIGQGEWAVFRPKMDDDGENECRDGVLVYVVDGAVVHTYDELSFVGGIRLFNGPRGQDAFVINCEESVERIAFSASILQPDAQAPDLSELIGPGAQGVNFEFSSDFGWYGDLFGGYASHVDGYDALFVIDRAAIEIVSLDSLVGERTAIDPHTNTAAVTPSTWTRDGEFDSYTIESTSSRSRVQIWTVPGTAEAPLAEGDELLSSDGVTVRLWNGSDLSDAQATSRVEATDWMFLVGDGIRVVRHIPRGDETVVIEMFSDGEDSSIDNDLPWLALELVQVFDGR